MLEERGGHHARLARAERVGFVRGAAAEREAAKERRGRREVQHLKFSTPQGEEVYEWLADKRLLPFATIFALNCKCS